MSQIPRYLYGSTNVSLLQSQRSSAITPAEGAAAAAAPYEAISKIAGSAADIEHDYRIRQMEEESKNDATQMSTNTALTQTGMKNTKTQAVAEGMHEDLYLENVEAQIEGYLDSGSMIGDRNRAEALKIFNANALIWRAEAQANAATMKTNRINKDQDAAYQVAHASGDYDGMRFLSDTRFATDKDSAAHTARNLEIDSLIDVSDAMEEGRALWLGPQGVDGVKRLHKEHMENPNKNEKTQAAIISGLNNMIGNINSAEKDRIDLKEAIITMEAIDVIQAMGDPTQPTVDPEVWIADKYADPDIDPKFLASIYKQMVVAQSSAKKDNNSFEEFRFKADNGDIMFGTTANRKNADNLIKVRANEAQKKAEAEGKEFGAAGQRKILTDTTIELGFAGYETSQQFKGGLSSPRGISSMGPLFHDLTSVSGKRIDLGMEDGEYQKYAAIEFEAMGAGGTSEDWHQAAERYNEDLNQASKDPSYTAYVNSMWEAEVAEQGTKDVGFGPAETAWDNMWDSEPYDKWNKWAMEKPDVHSPEWFDFLRYYEDGYKGGTGEHDQRNAQATNYAQKRFTEKNPPTNLNGKWQHDRDGVEGDADYKRIEWFEQNKDKQWFFLKDGKYTSGTLDDIEKLKFLKPDREPIRGVDQEGDIIYDATYDGGELIPYREGMTAEGLQYTESRTVKFSQKDQAQIKSRTENKEVIMAYEEEIAEWKRMLEGKPRDAASAIIQAESGGDNQPKTVDAATTATLNAAIKRREKEIAELMKTE